LIKFYFPCSSGIELHLFLIFIASSFEPYFITTLLSLGYSRTGIVCLRIPSGRPWSARAIFIVLAFSNFVFPKRYFPACVFSLLRVTPHFSASNLRLFADYFLLLLIVPLFPQSFNSTNSSLPSTFPVIFTFHHIFHCAFFYPG
jgi:hypothetical protein